MKFVNIIIQVKNLREIPIQSIANLFYFIFTVELESHTYKRFPAYLVKLILETKLDLNLQNVTVVFQEVEIS